MGQDHRAWRRMWASPARLWRAWTDPTQLVRWLPPPGMAAEVLEFDPRDGGALHLRLNYVNGTGGKTSADSDELIGWFRRMEPPHLLEICVAFTSDDPDFAGEMLQEWQFLPEGRMTRVTITCRDVPRGITAEAHADGLMASLAQLAALTDLDPERDR